MKERFAHCQRVAFLLAASFMALAASGAPFQLVSVIDSSQGPPSGGGGDSYAPIISPDGRYVLFASTANNLVANGATNPLPLLLPPKLNVFLRDRTNGTTTLVSVNLAGTGGGNGDSIPSGISTNGRYALFESSASDLVAGDTNDATDVFVRDLLGSTTWLVSASTNSGFGNGVSRTSAMTPDGRYVAFVSAANNLVPGDTNGIADVFVRDLQAGVTTLASVGAIATNHASPQASSESPDITPDGRYVAFFSTATNLVPGVTTVGEVYVRDRVGGTTVWASSYARTAVQAVLGETSATSYNHAISADGEFVAYEASTNPASAGVILRYSLQSGFTDVVNTNAYVPTAPLFTAPYDDIRNLDMTPDGRFIAFVANSNGTAGTNTAVYVWDAQTGTATLASGDLSNNVPANSICDWATIVPSGRFVAFLSTATNLVTNSLAGDYHLYVRDMQTATTALVDADTNGVGSPLSSASAPAMSADGRFVAFTCSDGNLVSNGRDRDYDVFVRDVPAGTNELISARDANLPSLTPNGASTLAVFSVSANGRYVAFFSDADNLAPNDTNRCRDVFVRDLLGGANAVVSIATNGMTTGDGVSMDPVISADGRYVAFSSFADNLVAGDRNQSQDVFVRDMTSGTTLLVSASLNGGFGSTNSYAPSISSDGRYVLFTSAANNLAAGSFSGANLFLRDTSSGTNYALTMGGVTSASMTLDGRYVAFGGSISSGSPFNLYVWDSQHQKRVYTNNNASFVFAISSNGNRIGYLGFAVGVADRDANTNWLVGLSPSSHAAGRFSGDGRFLAYVGSLNNTNQIYLYDVQTGTNLLVSRGCNSAGAANGPSDSPDLSADGRFVAYRSAAPNIVPGDSNGVPDVFLYDRLTGDTTLLSVSRFGNFAADNRSLTPVFSGDGQTVFFQSWASDLIPQDFNQGSDLFAVSLYSSSPIPLFYASVVAGSTPAQRPWITWPTVPGKSYRVQFKNDLSDANWQDLNGNVTLVGNQGYLNDLAAGVSQRFYRIVAF